MSNRPVLRYHGGKWQLAPWIIEHFPQHRVYVEPFGGAASVLMQKPRAYAEVYNDLDGEVVNLFRVLRDPAQAEHLERMLRLTPFAREEFVQSYIEDADPIEQARRTIIRSFMGFGSNALNKATGFRANSTRSGTTPAHDWANYADCLPAFTARLQGVVVENRPAEDVMAQHDGPDTLHYVDPPYVAETRGDGQYGNYRHEMTDAEHAGLARVLREVQGMVVLSGYQCEMYDALYGDWQCLVRNALADGARPRVEALWLSPRTVERLMPLFAKVQG